MTGFVRRWRALRQQGVLGMNHRNGRFVLPLNPRASYPRVDDKLLTKRLAHAAGIPAPHLLGVISHHYELRQVQHLLAGLSQFVLKPARGAQGNGVMVIEGVGPGGYRKASGPVITEEQIRQHISSTISGVFSLRGDWDSCLIETRVSLHPSFAPIAPYGVPDVRVIVYRGLPVMAMCRLPTSTSGGRANLHQGAIGVGLDMASGRALHARHLNRSVTHHVDTKAPIVGFCIPGWEDVLALATRASDISGLGYVGVDVVLDAVRGCLLLELNARPGLAIQLANGEGLLPRLRQAESLPRAALSRWEDRWQMARELFARPVALASP